MREIEKLLFGEKEATGFAKSLFFGRCEAAPFPQAPTSCEPILDSIRQLKIDGAAIDRGAPIPIKELAKLGVMGLTIPEEFGGAGGSQQIYCKVVEEIARSCSSTALFVNVHQSIGLKPLLLFGSGEQKRQWLPKLASGESIAAFSLTEEQAGSDAAAIETRAVYDPERRLYRLSGRKQWTTNGSIADLITVMAKTDKGISAFLVTPQMKGFSVVDAALEKVGMRGTVTSNLCFDEMEVPEENLLGEPGNGLKIALTSLDYGRTVFGAACTGVAKECLEMALQHAKERHQFGRPLLSFPLIRQKLAKMRATTYAMESITYFTAGLIDDGGKDVMIETALVKIFSSEALWDIVYEAMQIFGGRSLFCDLPLERMMRDARLNQIGEGTNEILRLFACLTGMRSVARGLKAPKILGLPKVEIESPHLQSETNLLARAIKRFGQRIALLLLRHRKEIVEEQLIVNRCTDALIAIYTSYAVLRRLDCDPGEDLLIGKFYCAGALENALSALSNNRDEMIEDVAW